MKFEGIYTPIITPFHEDGSVDWQGYADVIEWQIDNGVAGIIVGGSTGEFYAMSKQERIQQFEFAAERINKRVTLMAGVNDILVGECLAISVAARDAGADALLVAAPPYSLPSQSELAAHILKIADTAGLPIMLYNYPGRTGVEMGAEFLTAVSVNPLVCAIKESSGDYTRIPYLTRNFPDIQLIVGGEEQVLEFVAWGSKAWVCATGNFFPDECVKLMSTVANGDFELARALMAALMPTMSALEQSGKFVQSIKEGCRLQGRPSGIVRPPMQAMDSAMQQDVAAIITEAREALRLLFATKLSI
jgi:4-hydroxy-tetrahydrodipicolinate synthase